MKKFLKIILMLGYLFWGGILIYCLTMVFLHNGLVLLKELNVCLFC
jgi:hypothetical protein